jgi:hypothetical protein
MRYRAAAVVLALAAAVAIGQVPMYSDYPWGLLNNGTDQGPVWNLDCRGGLWCHLNGYGNGVIELGDGGALPITVTNALFANDAGSALLAGFANYAADAGLSSRSLFADDAGFAIFAGDAGRAFLSNFSDYAADAGYSQAAGLAGVATYALDAGLASKAIAADFARDAGSAASADLATYALDAGLSVAALWAGDAGFATTSAQATLAVYALDAGLSTKAIAADFARDAGSAANADFARDAGSAASADISTFALDAGRAVFAGFAADAGLSVAALYAGDAGLSVAALFAADAGNLQCTTCVDTGDIASSAVTTAKLNDLAVTGPKLNDGVSLSAYDEATVRGVSERSTATNCTESSWDGVTNYIRFTVGTAVTNPQVSTTLYTGNTTNVRTTTAIMRYRFSGGLTSTPPSTVRAINNANTGQTADAAFSADGNWHTAVFDISAWSTAGTLRVDLLLPSTLGTNGFWDISYLATGIAGGGTNSLVSYQGRTGVDVAEPSAILHAYAPATTTPSVTWNTLTGQNFRNSTSELTFGLSATSPNPLYMQGRTSSSAAQNLALQPVGGSVVVGGSTASSLLHVQQPASGVTLGVYGTASPVAQVVNTSNASATAPSLQVINYGANGGTPTLSTFNSRGTSASPSASSSGDVIGQWSSFGRATAAFAEGARIQSALTAAPGLSSVTAALIFSTANAGAVTERMRLTAAGNLGIGTTSLTDKLTVAGSAGTALRIEANVATSGTGDEAQVNLHSGDDYTRLFYRDSNSQFGIYHGVNGVYATKFRLTSTAMALMEGGGNVGIGTQTPSVKLHTFSTNENLRMEGTDPWASYYQSGTRKGWWGYGDTAGTTSFSMVNEVSTGNLRFDTNGGNYRFIDFNGGGTTGASLDNDGDLIRTPSDGRLKEDVHELTRNLDAVLRMRPVRFHWRDKQSFGSRWDIGFIAQEMMACVPEAVGMNPDGTYSLDYQKLISVVVGAVQELFEDRTALAQRIQVLEDRAQQAEDRVARLEARLLSLENYSGIKGCGNCPQTDDQENPK